MPELRAAGWVAAFVALSTAVAAEARPTAKGRAIDQERRTRWTVFGGGSSPIEGGVHETERPLNDVRDQETPEAPESFTFDELGLEESDSTWGLHFEHQWRWVTLFVNGTWMEASASATAPRDLFIGVKEVRFEGAEYDYQRIPAGAPYDADLDLFTANFRLAVTPFTLNAGGAVEFVPWVSVGLFTLAGTFDVDAGPATGVELYEFPPRQYVVGGSSQGEAAALAPEFGIGGELTFWLGERARLVVQGTYGFSDISASTSDLGVSSRNEKDISLDFRSIDARALVEIRLGRRTHLLLGVEYRSAEIDALSEAKDRPVDEVFELQEKFNKNVDLSIDNTVLSVGLRF